MKISRLTALLTSAVLTCISVAGCGNAEPMSEKTTMEIVQDMGLGINLGNTFEACGDWIDSSSVTNYETAWGSPVIAKATIQGYADAGFGVLRVPVAWSNMMQVDYTIHPDYMARVREIVDWAIDADLYVILNIHYDSGWWTDFAVPEKKDECMKKYTRIWEQITDQFQDYGEKLMFESLNEEGCWDSLWNRYSGQTEGKAEAFGLLNEINQTFVDLVRDSGGNNAKRHLLIAGYATDITLTCDAEFKMPDDPKNRCAVSVHYYTPPTFCILDKDADWGKAKSEWGSPRDLQELEQQMNLLKTTFLDKGIPVIVGEYGVAARKNKTAATINLYLTTVAEKMYDMGMCPVLWDCEGDWYQRETQTFLDEELLNAYREIAKGTDRAAA